MTSDLQALLVLQHRDQRILAIDADLAKIPVTEAKERARLQGDEQTLAATKAKLQETELAIKKVEMEIATRRTTIQRLKQQQFETRKNDEFQALGNEVIRYEGDIDKLETQELELMEQADANRATIAAADLALGKTRSLVEEDLAKLAQRVINLKAERAELVTERTKLAANAPEATMPLYEKLMKSKKGVAISPLVGNQCGGCHVKVIPATLVKVQADKEIAQCENCGRILYME